MNSNYGRGYGGYSMRRGILYICVIMALFSFTACNKGKNSLNITDVEVNTMLIKEDGVIQVAFVDDFDEPYYEEEELRAFIDEEIRIYNEGKNEEGITLVEYQVQDQKAKVILEYKSLDKYADFNQIEVKWLTFEEAAKSDEVPSVLTLVKDQSKVNKKEVLEENSKILLVNESLDVRLNGKVKAFSNCILLNDISVQTGESSSSVIIFQ